jgi:hypothetical protein
MKYQIVKMYGFYVLSVGKRVIGWYETYADALDAYHHCQPV